MNNTRATMSDNNSIDEFKENAFTNNLIFDLTQQIISTKKQNFKNLKKLKIGTLFSGIGAFEQALSILNIEHEISFACDNGGILLEYIMTEKENEILTSLNTPIEKLSFVEGIYKKSRKTNFVKKSYLANYELDESNFYHDVRFLTADINKDIDILVGGSPCQSFSIAGLRGGFEDTRGTLFFEFARCVKEFQPKVFIYENVKGLLSHDQGKTFATVLNTFDELGYKYSYQVLNAKDYGIPQNRQRIFVIGFLNHDFNYTFPTPIKLETTMAHYLQGHVQQKYYLSDKQLSFVRNPIKLKKKYTQINNDIMLCQRACQQYNLHGDFVDDKYYLSDKLIQYVMSEGTKQFKVKPVINSTIAKALLASMHKMHRASIDNYVTGKDNRLRKLTPRECLRLMGFCDTFEQVVSDIQMYKQAGNSIVVDVLMAIIIELITTGVFEQ
jgi:DNA (cytosine-5)-methyltransferase 1